MKDFRNTKGNRIKKSRYSTNTGILFVLITAAVVFVIVFTVSRVKTKTLSSELTPGKFYMKESRQIRTVPPDDAAKSGDSSDTKEKQDNGNKSEPPDSFTFYKSLNGREGNIIPLNSNGSNVQNIGKKGGEEDDKAPQPEKIMQIEDKIDKNLEKIVRKENIYTVQIAAFSSEETASDIINKLKHLGHSPYLIREDDKNGKKLIKVRLGKFSSKNDAQSVANVLRQGGYDTYVIKN